MTEGIKKKKKGLWNKHGLKSSVNSFLISHL